MNTYIEEYFQKIKRAVNLLQNADYVLVGVGSGVTAAGGLCYTDPELASMWYPEYYSMGKKSIIEIMSDFWANTINDSNATAFWGFWAKHIYHIRYEPEALQPYRDLFRIMEGKQFFIVSTNVDGQLEKAGFDKNVIFAPQGDYALFQCKTPCCHEVFDNKAQIYSMLDNMVSPFEIQIPDIPHCPRCGGHVMPNLRCDFSFVETPHVQNVKQYERFLTEAYDRKLVILELGVGYNTPTIIRLPFEAIALQYQNAALIRVNRDDATVLNGNPNESICMKEDVKKFLCDIMRATPDSVV
jgi:NAD-dependent SIR2 family protein deacetylase